MRIILALLLTLSIHPSHAQLYSPGKIGVRITCLPEFNYYSIQPLDLGRADLHRIFDNTINRDITNELQKKLERLSQNGIYLNLSTSRKWWFDRYVTQRNICHIPDGEIKTDVKIRATWNYNHVYGYKDQVYGADVKIWFNDKLILDTLFNSGASGLHINEIEYKKFAFHVLRYEDNKSTDQYLIKFFPESIDSSQAASLAGICSQTKPYLKVKLPILWKELNQIHRSCTNNKHDFIEGLHKSFIHEITPEDKVIIDEKLNTFEYGDIRYENRWK